jgi:hypothetical protein
MTDNKEMLDALEKGIAMMKDQPMDLKEQYLAMLLMLTECFAPDAEAGCVLLFKPDDERVAVCVSNLSTSETMWAMESALEGMVQKETQHAPPREMFN